MPKTIPVAFSIKDQAEKPVEILIYDVIGQVFADGGFTAKEFGEKLSAIDQNRELHVRVNSRGGFVNEGIAIYNRLREWKGKTVATVDGSAASIASVIIMGADEVHMPESAEIMIHEAHGIAAGNADDMRGYAEDLERASQRIAKIYADKSGKPEAHFRDLMKKTTVLNGKQSKELGLADVLTSEKAIYNFSPEDISRFKIEPGKPPAPKEGALNDTTTIMKREELLALLKEHGAQVANDATDEQLRNLLKETLAAKKANPQNQDVIDLTSAVKALQAQNKAERETRIKGELNKLVVSKQMTNEQSTAWLPRVIADETVLDQLRDWPVKPEITPPLDAGVDADSVIKADASPVDTAKALARFHEPVKAWQRGNNIAMKIIGQASTARAHFFAKNQAKIMEAMNAGTNTVDATLQRDAILQLVVEDFERRLLPVKAFATNISNVPLEGTNKAQVRFYDLDTGASTSFKSTDGYVAGDTATDNREIQIGKRATADVADDTKQYDRKYQGLSFTSEEIARQPFLDIVRLARLKADKLASDIIAHVLGIVTAANYGAAAVIEPAGAFDSDDVATLKAACKTWPEAGRTLILDSAYDASLLKDSAIKGALNYGGSEAIRQGRIPQLFGFDYIEIPTIPANGENLVGMAVFMSAIAFAQAPVPPIEEVRRDGTTYSIVTGKTGISFEYRTFGNSQMDSGLHFIEASYGFAKLNGNALKRITSA